MSAPYDLSLVSKNLDQSTVYKKAFLKNIKKRVANNYDLLKEYEKKIGYDGSSMIKENRQYHAHPIIAS